MKWVEFEPMSEARWSRVERKVLDSLDEDAAPARSGRRKWLALSGAGIVAAACATWIVLGHATHEREGARIVTNETASRVEFDDAVLDVAPKSAATLGHDHDGVLVTIDRGRVEFEVGPRKPGRYFDVVAGDVRVRVVGTHFVVARGPNESDVDVERGVVRVTANGATATLHAGDHWSTAPRDTHPPPLAASSQAAVESPEPPPEVVHEQPSASASPPMSAQREFELAAALEKSDPDRAVATYERIAHRGGTWAENALYAEGRLEIDRGHVDRGRRVLQTYLARYPHGDNAKDARALLERVPF